MSLNIETIQFMNRSKAMYIKLIGEVAKKYNLTNNECDVLLFLHRNHELNTARDIAEHRMIAKSNVSTAIESLKKSKLLDVRPDEKSRRVFRLCLLPNSKIIVDELLMQQSIFKNIFEDGLSDNEKSHFENTVAKINQNMVKALQEK